MMADKEENDKQFVRYWSMNPGTFLNKYTGEEVLMTNNNKGMGPMFGATVLEWFGTLFETINDVVLESAKTELIKGDIAINRKLLGIFEMNVGYRPNLEHYKSYELKDVEDGLVGVLNQRYNVFLDESQPADRITIKVEDGSTSTVIIKHLDPLQ